jgi:ABC-2 type transport system ATP-binding protein
VNGKQSKSGDNGGTYSEAVKVLGLKKIYGKVTALEKIDLQVNQGIIFGLVGPNGAGKTTLIKALIGALRPTAGTISVLGLDPIQDRWQLRQQVGYMPQALALYPDLSARFNISFFCQAHPIEDLQNKIDEILDFTELAERADDPVSSFSGGMQKRVSLACALAHQPEIIFLDEPTAAVDPHLRHRMWQLFRDLAAEGATLFISTHMMEEALLCSRVAVLRQGKIIANDTPERILERGRSHLSVTRRGKEFQQTIAATPEALASGLAAYGLPADVDSIVVKPDTLEDVILDIIQDQEER